MTFLTLACIQKSLLTQQKVYYEYECSFFSGNYLSQIFQTDLHDYFKKKKKKIITVFRTGISPREIRVAFPRESQLQQSRATQSTVHTGCFSVPIIHRTVTWTTGSSPCAQMLMHAIEHGGVRTPKESALEVDSGRKISCPTGESNLRQWRACPTLHQLSSIPTLH